MLLVYAAIMYLALVPAIPPSSIYANVMAFASSTAALLIALIIILLQKVSYFLLFTVLPLYLGFSLDAM